MHLPLTGLRRAALPILAVAAFSPHAAAATALTVNVTMTIDAVIAIEWCDDAVPTNTATANQTWALGTGVALSTIYDTDTGDGTNALGGTGATAPSFPFIRNASNTTVDVDGKITNPASWTADTAPAANKFEMEAKIGAGSYVTLSTSDAEVLDAMTVASGSVAYFLRLSTPTSITVGGGIQQTIPVIFTASLAD